MTELQSRSPGLLGTGLRVIIRGLFLTNLEATWQLLNFYLCFPNMKNTCKEMITADAEYENYAQGPP